MTIFGQEGGEDTLIGSDGEPQEQTIIATCHSKASPTLKKNPALSIYLLKMGLEVESVNLSGNSLLRL